MHGSWCSQLFPEQEFTLVHMRQILWSMNSSQLIFSLVNSTALLLRYMLLGCLVFPLSKTRKRSSAKVQCCHILVSWSCKVGKHASSPPPIWSHKIPPMAWYFKTWLDFCRINVLSFITISKILLYSRRIKLWAFYVFYVSSQLHHKF